MLQVLQNIGTTSLEQGFILAIVALGVVIAFRFLDFPDLTVDGSFVLGAAVTAKGISAGLHPLWATALALPCGALAGLFTAFVHTELRVGKLLSSILTMTMLYSINLRLMGRSNIPLIDAPTVLKPFESNHPLLIVVLVALACALLAGLGLVLATETGAAMRAVGEGETLIRGLGMSVDYLKFFGLALTNMLTALGGAIYAQHQGYCDITMGIGTILIALASIVIGEAFVRPTSPLKALTAALTGAIIYQFLITIVLYLGMPPTDLRLATGLLIIGCLLFRGRDSDTSLEAVARNY